MGGVCVVGAKDLEKIGLEKIMSFLELSSKEEFLDFLVDKYCPTLSLLAKYLSQFAVVCQY